MQIEKIKDRGKQGNIQNGVIGRKEVGYHDKNVSDKAQEPKQDISGDVIQSQQFGWHITQPENKSSTRSPIRRPRNIPLYQHLLHAKTPIALRIPTKIQNIPSKKQTKKNMVEKQVMQVDFVFVRNTELLCHGRIGIDQGYNTEYDDDKIEQSLTFRNRIEI
jgi:hypothetical protein